MSDREKRDRRAGVRPELFKKLRSSLRRVIPKRKCGRSLLQSTLMAHKLDRLVLLYPYPDTVHGGLLHKTLLSSRLTSRSRPYGGPRRAFGLAIADCKFRAPLAPHLVQQLHYITRKLRCKAKKERQVAVLFYYSSSTFSVSTFSSSFLTLCSLRGRVTEKLFVAPCE